MDEEIDNGDIVVQKKINIDSYDTSENLYNKILKAEVELFYNVIEDILKNNYTTFKPESKGNINYKKDFDKLKELNLNQKLTVKELIDLLRAMTYKNYKNTYFIDENGDKIYVRLSLEKE